MKKKLPKLYKVEVIWRKGNTKRDALPGWWEVRCSEGPRPFVTKLSAVRVGKQVAKAHQPSSLIVYTKEHRFQEERTYPRSRDPRRSTEIIIVLDRSGSMQKIRGDMEGGLDKFFEDQRKLPGRCTVTLTQFSDRYEVVYQGCDIKDVPQACLVPDGTTALLDAVGRTINEVGKRLADTPEAERPGRVLFLIITDGRENASREFRRDDIKKMVQHQTEKYSWQFVYLGANQDAFAEASSIGISLAQDYHATKVGTKDMVASVSRGTERYRGGGGYKTS